MRIRSHDLDFYYEIYRNGVLWVTVLTWKEVLDYIFDDHVKTGGVFEYSFELFDKRKKHEEKESQRKESPLQFQILRLDV